MHTTTRNDGGYLLTHAGLVVYVEQVRQKQVQGYLTKAAEARSRPAAVLGSPTAKSVLSPAPATYVHNV